MLASYSICGDSGGILTLDLQNRNLTLYTAKLRSHESLWQRYNFPVNGERDECFSSLSFSLSEGATSAGADYVPLRLRCFSVDDHLVSTFLGKPFYLAVFESLVLE